MFCHSCNVLPAALHVAGTSIWKQILWFLDKAIEFVHTSVQSLMGWSRGVFLLHSPIQHRTCSRASMKLSSFAEVCELLRVALPTPYPVGLKE